MKKEESFSETPLAVAFDHTLDFAGEKISVNGKPATALVEAMMARHGFTVWKAFLFKPTDECPAQMFDQIKFGTEIFTVVNRIYSGPVDRIEAYRPMTDEERKDPHAVMEAFLIESIRVI